MAIYIGLMSGTSLDAIDAAAVEITDQQINLLNAISYPLPDHIKSNLHKLIADKGEDNIDLLGTTDAQMGLLFAEAVQQLLSESGLKPENITAIGSHGQTIRHRPENELAFSIQIGDASRIAEKTGITTVTDFRRRDIAAGGQGAPLVPAFHRSVFGSEDEHRCIVNIGGMANISYLPRDKNATTSGFDTGPGNILIDSWCQQHTGKSYDENGNWARSGLINNSILMTMLNDPYFSLAAPKSTGREYFNTDWLNQLIGKTDKPAEDIQACLTELTAKTIVDAVDSYFSEVERLIICGGGCHNLYLTERIRQLADKREVDISTDFGIEPDWVEAAAFAWLAHCTLNKIPANVPAVTGAHSPVILGAIYPA